MLAADAKDKRRLCEASQSGDAEAPSSTFAVEERPEAAAAAVFTPGCPSSPETAPQLVSAALAALLADPRVLPFGGSLVFHCEHRYPHTAAELAGAAGVLARSLKGQATRGLLGCLT
jgi:hypothetical protein